MADPAYHDSRGKFAPGNPGGPGQKGKRAMLTPHLVRLLEEAHPLEPGKTRGEVLARKLVELADTMEEWAVKLVYDRAEGKARESIGLEVDLPGPIQLLNLGDADE